MQCDPNLLIEYVCGRLEIEEIEKVTDHLEVCPQCAERLQWMARLRANRVELRAELYRVSQASEESMPFAAEEDRFSWTGVRTRGYLWAAAAVLLLSVCLSLLYFLFSVPAGDIALLATAGKPPYEPMVLRNGEAGTPTLFRQAMEAYEKGDHPSARARLEQYVRQVNHDSEALFYLGAIHYLQGDLPQADTWIRRGLAACTIASPEKYHWYLAQIAMKQHRREEARSQLQQVAEFGGEYAEQARALLAKL